LQPPAKNVHLSQHYRLAILAQTTTSTQTILPVSSAKLPQIKRFAREQLAESIMSMTRPPAFAQLVPTPQLTGVLFVLAMSSRVMAYVLFARRRPIKKTVIYVQTFTSMRKILFACNVVSQSTQRAPVQTIY